MPVVDLAGDDFTVAWKDKELLIKHDTGSTTNLYDLPLDVDAQSYLCFYHLPSKSAMVIPENITKIPEDIVLLKIPHEFFLDPVGAARQYGLEDTFLLQQYPLQEKIKAEVIPIEASGLPDLVKANNEKARQHNAGKRFFPGTIFKREKKKGKGM